MFCAKCGNEIIGEAKFCPSCGQPTRSAEENVELVTEQNGQQDNTQSEASNEPQYNQQNQYSGQGQQGQQGQQYSQYGQYQQGQIYNAMPEQKSRLVAGLLQIFLGGFGVGRFYLGYTGIGVAQLLTVWLCGAGYIWGFIDGILILCGQVPNDANGVPLKE